MRLPVGKRMGGLPVGESIITCRERGDQGVGHVWQMHTWAAYIVIRMAGVTGATTMAGGGVTAMFPFFCYKEHPHQKP